MSKHFTPRYVMTAALSMVAVGLLSLSISAASEDNVGEERDAALCILAQLSDHRLNSYDVDRDAAAAERRPFNVPRPAPAQFPSTLSEACSRYLKNE